MNNEKLREKLNDLENQLDDEYFERSMISNQRGQHISSQKIAQQIKECDEEIEKLEKKILEIKKQIKE